MNICTFLASKCSVFRSLVEKRAHPCVQKKLVTFLGFKSVWLHFLGANLFHCHSWCYWTIFTGRHITLSQQSSLNDLHFVQHGEHQLLVTSDVRQGVSCYDATSGELKWRVKGRVGGMEKAMNLRGVTSDGKGHLFVYDHNNHGIQMLSVNGMYMGCVFKAKHQVNHFRTEWIRWCSRTSSLVLAHNLDEINVIKSYL